MIDDDRTVPEGIDRSTGVRIGAGVALVRDDILVLLDPSEAAVAPALWGMLEAGTSVDALLAALSARGIAEVGAFVIAQYESDGVRVVVRGAAGAELVVDGARQTRLGSERRWADDVLPLPSSMTLWLGAPSGEEPAYFFSAGVLPADLLHRGERAPLSIDATSVASMAEVVPAELPRASPAPAALTAPPPALAAPSAPPPPGATTEPVVPPAQADDGTHDQADDGWTLPAQDLHEPPAPDASPTEAIVVEPAAPDADEYDFDAMYGHTVARSVQAAAVRPVDESDDEPMPGAPAAAPSPSVGAPQTFGPPPATNVIDGIPPIAAEPSGRPGDHDGRTMTKAQLDAMRAQQSGAPPPVVAPVAMGGPTVQALPCPLGHLNPTHVAACRICAAPLSGTPVTVARPALGRLRFTTGESVVLDRPVIVGRNPRLTGQSIGELPLLLKLDIGNGLSRSHAIVQLEGWHVLVEDLGSANGTVVTLPGRPPRRLHPGEPLLLDPMAEIDFGGEVSAVYDPV